MRRGRTITIWLCLLTLVWCQLAAAAAACGTTPAAGPIPVADADAAPCHGSGTDDDGCAPACSVGHGLKDTSVHASDLAPLSPERFEAVLALLPPALSLHPPSRIPARPPPHFLGRLLI
jgi:hypothetical protein